MAFEIYAKAEAAVQEIGRLQTKVTTLNKTLATSEALNKKLATSYTQAKTSISGLEQAVASLKLDVRTLKKENLELSASLNSVTAASTKATAATNAATGAYTNQASAIRGVAGAMGSLWLAYGNVVPMMAGFAAASVIQNIEKLGAAFEYTTTFVESLDSTAASAKVSLEEIQETLLGFDGLRRSANELATGMKEFAKAGVSATESLGQMESMAKFATLAEIDLGKATELVVGQTNAFGGAFEDTANKISAGALSSATTIEKFGTALTYTTELGTVMGFSIDEVAASLALLANKSIVGSKAGTALRTSFMKLLDPSEKATKMMTELGVEFSAMNNDGSIKGLEQQLKEFASETSDLAEGELAQLMRELVGLRALKGFGNLIADVDKFDGMRSKIAASAGEVDFLSEKLSKLDNTVVAKWERFTASWENLLITLNNSTLASSGIWMMQAVVDSIEKMATLPADVLDPWINLIKSMGDGDDVAEQAKRVEAFAEQFGGLRPKVQDATSDIEDWGAAVRTALNEVGGNVAIPAELTADIEAIDSILEQTFATLDKASEDPPDIFAILEYELNNIDSALEDFFTSVEDLAKVNSKIDDSLEDFFEDVEKAAEKSEKALKKQEAATNTFYTSLKELNNEILVTSEYERLLNEERTKTEEMLNKLAKQHSTESDIYKQAKADAEAYLETWKEKSPEALAANDSFFDGLKAGFLESQKDLTTWGDVGKDVYDTFESSLGTALATSMESMLDFSDGLGGIWDNLKDAWSDMLDTMVSAFISSLATMAAEAAAAEVWSYFTEDSGSSSSSSSSSSSDSSSWISTAGTVISTLFSAQGNVIPAGPGIGAYSNSIVDSPTVFPFASGGAVGVMGEAGAEAIMPLTRTSGGDLGVSSVGSIGGSSLLTAIELLNESLNDVTEVTKDSTEAATGSTTASEDAEAATNKSEETSAELSTSVEDNKDSVDSLKDINIELGWDIAKAAATFAATGNVIAAAAQVVKAGYDYVTSYSDARDVSDVMSQISSQSELEAQGITDVNDRIDENLHEFFDDLDNSSESSDGMSDSNQGTAGGGAADDDGGAGWGFAAGGVVDTLMVPDGDDGFAALSYGEGVVSQEGMENLAALNSGEYNGTTYSSLAYKEGVHSNYVGPGGVSEDLIDDSEDLIDYMTEVYETLNNRSFGDFDLEVRDIVSSMEDAVATAEELGADWADVWYVQKEYRLQIMELMEEQKQALVDSAADQLSESIDSYIGTLEDAADEADDLLAAAEDALNSAFSAEASRISEAYASKVETLNERLDSANDALDDASDAVSTLESAISSLSDASLDSQSLGFFEAIATLAERAASGDLSGDLSGDVDAATDFNTDYFASAVDYNRQFSRVSNYLEDLQTDAVASESAAERTVTGIEYSIERAEANSEAQLAALDDQLDVLLGNTETILSVEEAIEDFKKQQEEALRANELLETQQETLEAQYNSLLGIDTSVMSVEEAVNNLKGALSIKVTIPSLQDLQSDSITAESVGFASGGSFTVAGPAGVDNLSMENLNLTAGEVVNVSHGDSMADMVQQLAAIKAELQALRSEGKAQMHAVAINTGKTAKQLNRWDGDGLPEERVL